MAFSYEELAALEAWKLPKGEHDIDLTQLGHDLRYRVIRHSKFVLVFSDKGVIAFPKPEHMPIFIEAVKGLEPDGPGSNYLGSIGSIYAPKHDGKQYITMVQNHYRQESDHPIPATVASKYLGWRKTALDEIIGRAKKDKTIVHIGKRVITPSGIGTPMRFNDVLLQDFKEIAQKHGAELEDDWTSQYRYKIDFTKK